MAPDQPVATVLVQRRHNYRGSVSFTWWTESGSKRKKATVEAVLAAVEYVRNQPHPLVIHINEDEVLRLQSIAGERGASAPC